MQRRKQAAKLGGIPLPSVAVSRLDQPYQWGGENGIVLIAGSELADPKLGNDVYSADAYSGTFPELKEQVSDKAPDILKEVHRLVDIVTERYKFHGSFFKERIHRIFDKPLDYDSGLVLRSEYGLDIAFLFAASHDYKFRTPMRDYKLFSWEDEQLLKGTLQN